MVEKGDKGLFRWNPGRSRGDQPRQRADCGRRRRLRGGRPSARLPRGRVHPHLHGRRGEPGISGGPSPARAQRTGGGQMTGGSSARKPLMAGNWKMHNTHFEGLALVQKLAFTLTGADFDAAEVVVLPPFTALRSVQTLVAGDKLRIGYGAQDLSPHDKGAYTGDVSGPMLAKLGCGYVLAGHSERRQYHGEDDALVNAKVKAALRAELTPILCVGEHLDVRRAGEQLSFTLSQLDGALAGISPEQVAGLVVAYEPGSAPR